MKGMNVIGRCSIVMLSLIAVLALLGGCAGGGQALKTEFAKDPSAISGSYAVMLYNDGTYQGLKTLGILSLLGSGYTIQPYASNSMYTTYDNLPGQEALQTAIKFVQQNPAFTQAQISTIFAPSGQAIGYEVRPLFAESLAGYANTMTVTYFLEANNTVQAYIEVIPPLKRMQQGGRF